MKCALLGRHISHSLSPSIYRRLLGDRLDGYDLLDINCAADIPSLETLVRSYDGLNITSPYKPHFFSKVTVTSDIARKIGAINTISLKRMEGTNTDALAVEAILKRYLTDDPSLYVVLLGNGVMGKMTELILDKLEISYQVFARSLSGDISALDLRPFSFSDRQTLVINSCSREYEFKGNLNPDFFFWDYNYKFTPHSLMIPALVKRYDDGTEMLERQAQEAIRFWLHGHP